MMNESINRELFDSEAYVQSQPYDSYVFNIIVDNYLNEVNNICMKAANLLRGKSSNKEDVSERYTKCNLKNITHDTEFSYLCNSRTLYEDMLIRCPERIYKGKSNQNKIDRYISIKDRYCTDSTFPFFKNLMYAPGQNSNREHYEINFYSMVPAILYYIKNVESYDNDKFKSQYTPLEYRMLLDLFNSIVLKIINKDELELFERLVNKDKVLRELWGEINDEFSSKGCIKLSLNVLGNISISNITPTIPHEILGMIISVFCNYIMAGFIKTITCNQTIIVLKSFYDFRFILGVKKDYNIKFNFVFKETHSRPEWVMTPLIYKGNEALEETIRLVSDFTKGA